MNPWGILPQEVDLRPKVDNVDDQGQFGACVWNSNTKNVEVLYERDGQPGLELSRLYGYNWTRIITNTLGQEGSSPAVAAMVWQTKGCCLESSFAYTDANEKIQPPASLDVEAALYKIKTYEALPQVVAMNRDWIMHHLAQGKPVSVSFPVTGDFQNAAGAITNWRLTTWNPNAPPSGAQGWHDVVFIGYSIPAQCFLVQNSWGPGWADGGFFGFPFVLFDQLWNPMGSTAFAFTGLNVAIHPVDNYYAVQPKAIFGWYRKFWRFDVLDENDPAVLWWARRPDTTYHLWLTAYGERINAVLAAELAAHP